MPSIRRVEISRFRGINALSWYPKPGLNCLIGPGDSCKSTILTAIDFALGARRNISFSDADFFCTNTEDPIEITVTLGDLPDELLHLDKYGLFHRGYDATNYTLYDEPVVNLETVISVRLTVRNDLQPEWGLYSDRALNEGVERSIPWAQRELIAPIKLDTTNDRHLTWGVRSLLNRLSDDAIDISGTLASVARQTRNAFNTQPIPEFTPVLTRVKQIADRQGVELGELKALLDVNGVSLSNGSVSLHNQDNTPLRQLGTGSTRLLVSGIQYETSNASILLIDEAEYGLEPFRITKLLNNLGAKSEPPGAQVFITTHSPVVLRELKAEQVWIVRKQNIPNPPVTGVPQPAVAPPSTLTHTVKQASSVAGAQATLRSNPEAFFARKVLVCEGKTEIGLCRGIDLFRMDSNNITWLEKGVAFADGGGDRMFERATVFQVLGYRTAIFKDSDKPNEHLAHSQQMAVLQIPVIEWGNGFKIETALFSQANAALIPRLLQAAVAWKGQQRIDAHLMNASNGQQNYSSYLTGFSEVNRSLLGEVAGSKGWLKDIEPMESVGRTIVGPYHAQFSAYFQQILNSLFGWLDAQ